MSIELPKSLERAMRNAGLVDPRSDNPSLNQWSKESGVHTSTISSFLTGRKSRPANVQKMADALEVSPTDLYSMVGRELSPWSPPSGTEKLNTRQRQALNELILAFIDEDPAEKAGEGNADSPTPMNQAGVSPATGEDDGLGAFGGRARGDLDHESKNDGAGNNVYSLVPPPPASDTAAYRAPNRGKNQKDKQDEDAEGSQDSGDDE
ncbi:helix-turn-helix transcriptional regulator [Brevibacterium sp. ZH18]|uniref:helix-turn-helix domain-containing protein n=1 Tax=Brevibacterium sp. ZH18 TaxID=2927784 RepID=UPI001F61D218|nr:helix-turn-helix transcriptional regulator [Brevibacterium sp. ZH18]MCI4012338.1 helix-turn-helix domain-containing protein [Brevibacterium sp. ZH18]